jgi:hypothetical protein
MTPRLYIRNNIITLDDKSILSNHDLYIKADPEGTACILIDPTCSVSSDNILNFCPAECDIDITQQPTYFYFDDIDVPGDCYIDFPNTTRYIVNQTIQQLMYETHDISSKPFNLIRINIPFKFRMYISRPYCDFLESFPFNYSKQELLKHLHTKQGTKINKQP